MKATMPLGDFLVAYLKKAGVTHIFGLPGDLVLGLFHRFGSERGLDIVTFSHEPSVGFAALVVFERALFQIPNHAIEIDAELDCPCCRTDAGRATAADRGRSAVAGTDVQYAGGGQCES